MTQWTEIDRNKSGWSMCSFCLSLPHKKVSTSVLINITLNYKKNKNVYFQSTFYVPLRNVFKTTLKYS